MAVLGGLVSCSSCGSNNQVEFAAEINLHHSGLKNVNRQAVLVFSKVEVCLDCGSSRFSTPNIKLAMLAAGTEKVKA